MSLPVNLLVSDRFPFKYLPAYPLKTEITALVATSSTAGSSDRSETDERREDAADKRDQSTHIQKRKPSGDWAAGIWRSQPPTNGDNSQRFPSASRLLRRWSESQTTEKKKNEAQIYFTGRRRGLYRHGCNDKGCMRKKSISRPDLI
ncbi:hypothetical protein L1887_15323 [Cichorium endivia]|nr:hypothetical protein L1887_15323 [Cichorium endivia]